MRAPAGELRVVEDLAALHRAGAEEVARAAVAAVAARGRFAIALTGGTTPRGLYALLAEDPPLRGAILWEQVDVFFGDERCVPPDHPESNHRMANEALLSRVPLPPGNVRRMEGEREPAEAAARYEAALRERFGEGLPRLDLVLLGLGADGHVASLFPGTAALAERERLAVANHVPRLDSWRITLTLPVLNAAAEVLFLVAGEQKSWAVAEVFDPDADVEDVPARLVQPASGELRWLVDRAAAARLAPIAPR
jgi:6-phosphogluconolactonase